MTWLAKGVLFFNKFDLRKMSIGRVAMMLAMTESRDAEEECKMSIMADGSFRKPVATEVSGTLNDFKQKVVKNAVTASIHTNVIEDNPRQIHAVVHAVLEASNGVLIAAMANPSIKVKTAIVSDGEWVAVAMYGVTALHIQSNHERAGLGIMHL